MKIRIIIFAAAILTLASCAQHVCPTYQNSGVKYHHHQPHPTAPHHNH